MQINYLLAIFVLVYVFQMGFDSWLEKLNRDHAARRGIQVPASFDGFIDSSRLSEINSYTCEKSRVAVARQLISDSVLLGLVLSGFLPFLVDQSGRWELGFYTAGLFFFLAPGLLLHVVELPFDYYHTFIIEEKFGFNRSTLRIWIVDLIKSALLSVLVFSGLLLGILWLIRVSPGFWWLLSFVVVSCVQLLLVVLYPAIIAPLFNKFEPIKDELLAKRIVRMFEENGIKVKKILQMNAGIRSRHSNAYFTGLGKTKQIVLFDTLLESHPHDEILSVLAHEVGHFKNKHIVKQLLLFGAFMLAAFFLTYLLMDWPTLYSTFGFERPKPYIGLFIIGIFWQKAGFCFQPFYMALSRCFERQADLFVEVLLNDLRPMITALKRMAADNLSNLTPHPLYVWFNYSHPPLIERIASLEKADLEAAEPPAKVA